MCAYLFVHFKEKRTPDGEQVYFGISRNGFDWESVNQEKPVLWSYYGDKGVRDHTIIRTKTGEFVILATDLSLSYGMLNQYQGSWETISRHGSKSLALWRSQDLINWEPQEMIPLGNEHFGCLWAPDIIYDQHNEDYIVHWSSAHADNNFGPKAIYYARTKDFRDFSEPNILYKKEDSGVIDSAMYEENGLYYLFVKSEGHPANIILLRSDHITGPFEKIEAFDHGMGELETGVYEAPTATKLADNRWALFLDFYGTKDAAGHGYIPFLADSLASGEFTRADTNFSFPYGFKHGTILAITDEEFERLQHYQKQPSEY
ncbi:glycoside hydrolase family 43 protein [Gracilibacillus timonensis]|uniref:glycoside hydrolase family 43 protein n=1 Tax=Gracilibacillus timonensis TaxID=1816696 RepID=UPI0008255C53|nr:glycoside hydrolase family 43 protein [Gracilibacillus timonensis]